MDLALFYPDLQDWPRSWCGTGEDIAPGEQIVDCFRPFLQHLAAGYARKTIRLHAGNLWILGGERDGVCIVPVSNVPGHGGMISSVQFRPGQIAEKLKLTH